jgi:hypothetical protein
MGKTNIKFRWMTDGTKQEGLDSPRVSIISKSTKKENGFFNYATISDA